MKHGWPLKKVGELFDVQLGKMLSPRAKEGEQFPYLANFNVQWGKFNLENVKSMHFTESEREKYSLKQGDILMCEGGEVGRCAIWHERSTNFYYQKALHRLRPKNKNAINPYFMCIYMEHVTANNGVTKIVGETSIAHLTREKLCALKIPRPSKDQQDKIVKTISTWDVAIEKTERLIAAKEKQFKWLLKRLISDQKNNPKQQKVKLGEVCTLEYGKPLKEQDRKAGKYPVFGSNGIVGYHDKYLIEGPFIIVGRKGSAGMVQYSIVDGFPIDTTFYIKVQEQQISLLFLYYLLLGSNLNKMGLQSGVPGLNRNDVHKVKIQLSSLAEQKRIANILDAAKKDIALLEQLTYLYRRQKREIMQKLLMGKWRVTPGNNV